VGKPEGKSHLENPGVGRIILRWIFKRWDGGMDWTDLAQDRYRWWAAVYAVRDIS